MKKSILSIAILAAFSAAAQAQSNVTIYGVADSYLDFGNNGQSAVSRLQSGGIFGSRIGFRGTEDLGGGLSALFTLENGLNLDDGTAGQGGLLFGRQAFVGLSGNFGTVTLGRQYSPLFSTLATYGLGGGMGWGNASNYFADTSVLRINNSVVFSSPKMSGVTLKAMYGLGENAVPGQATVGNTGSVSGQYDVGNFSANVAYLRRNTTAANKDSWTAVGASYNFGVATLGTLYQARRDDAGIARNDYVEIGATIPLANASLLVDLGKFKNKLADNADASVLSIRYDYFLSKRTTLYAGAAKMRNDANAGFGINGATSAALTVATGDDPRSLIAGIRHTF